MPTTRPLALEPGVTVYGLMLKLYGALLSLRVCTKPAYVSVRFDRAYV